MKLRAGLRRGKVGLKINRQEPILLLVNQKSPGYYLPKEDQDRYFQLLPKAKTGVLTDGETEKFLELNLRDQPPDSFALVSSLAGFF
jgi:hypothetical protein